MHLHDVGEPFVEMVFRRLLNKFSINFLPPGSLRGVDYLLTDGDFIFVELEDTVFEIYNAAIQMRRIYGIAEIYNGYVAVAFPTPSVLSSIRSPLAYFFKITRSYRIRRELWLLLNDKIIKIYEASTRPSRVLSEISISIPVETEAGLITPLASRNLVARLRDVMKKL